MTAAGDTVAKGDTKLGVGDTGGEVGGVPERDAAGGDTGKGGVSELEMGLRGGGTTRGGGEQGMDSGMERKVWEVTSVWVGIGAGATRAVGFWEMICFVEE